MVDERKGVSRKDEAQERGIREVAADDACVANERHVGGAVREVVDADHVRTGVCQVPARRRAALASARATVPDELNTQLASLDGLVEGEMARDGSRPAKRRPGCAHTPGPARVILWVTTGKARLNCRHHIATALSLHAGEGAATGTHARYDILQHATTKFCMHHDVCDGNGTNAQRHRHTAGCDG